MRLPVSKGSSGARRSSGAASVSLAIVAVIVAVIDGEG
jgi:hypothetical protein